MFHHKGRTQSWRSSQSRTVNISRRGKSTLVPVEVGLYSMLRNHWKCKVIGKCHQESYEKIETVQRALYKLGQFCWRQYHFACILVRNDFLLIVDLNITTLSRHPPTCVASIDSLYNWTALIWLSTHANSPVQRGFPEMESVLKLWLLFVFSLNCCCSYKSRHCRHKQCCLPI